MVYYRGGGGSGLVFGAVVMAHSGLFYPFAT